MSLEGKRLFIVSHAATSFGWWCLWGKKIPAEVCFTLREERIGPAGLLEETNHSTDAASTRFFKFLLISLDLDAFATSKSVCQLGPEFGEEFLHVFGAFEEGFLEER